MDKTLSCKYSKIKRRYGEVRQKKAISFLNIAQSTAAFNDNLFKFLTIYLLIDLLGGAASTSITFFAGVFYVLPFLLFSGISGAIADKYSKQKIIVWMKVLEVVIIGIGFYVYYHKIVWGCYGCIFLLSLQSAIMSPSKFGIISELVKKEEITKANSYVTSYTYLSIIFGTFMAAFLTQVTGRNFLVCLLCGLLASIFGLIASMGIPETKAMGQKIVANRPPFSQLKETLEICKKTPKLLLAVLGSSFFLFVGAFTQLNLIPFAITSLGLSEVGGGYLFVSTSLGIALGSYISGKVCRKEVHLGLSAFALVVMSMLVFMIPMFTKVAIIAVILGFIGLFGGLYQIPLESFTQTFCSSKQRGKVVAAGNFLSFAGVLLAPISMALFEKVFRLSPAAGFVMLGLIITSVSFFFVQQLFVPFIHFLSKATIHNLYDIYYRDYPYAKKYEEQRVAVFLQGLKKRCIFLFLGENMHGHIFFIRKKAKKFDRYLSRISGIECFNLEDKFSAKEMRSKLTGLLTKTRPIFILEDGVEFSMIESFIADLEKQYFYSVKEMILVNETHFRASIPVCCKKTALVFSFKDLPKILKKKSLEYSKNANL